METKFLDLTRLLEVADGDTEFVTQVLTEYAHTVPELLTELQTAIDHEDLLGVQSRAHDLKGTSQTVGAYALAEGARAVEMAARDEDWDAIRSLRRNLEATWNETQQEVSNAA
ncbi:MAG: Hpt domain-containing protein [Chthonomonas sp.]|nr:Hpt domain-containing protein [Chthonomonas sp.]